MYKLWSLPLLIAFLAFVSLAQQNNVGSSDRVVIEEVEIAGTSTLDTQQLQEITNSLTTLRTSSNEEELRQRIKDAFQERGYFNADVTGLKVVTLDPLEKCWRVFIVPRKASALHPESRARSSPASRSSHHKAPWKA